MRAYLPGEDWIVTAATKLGKREPVLAAPTDPQFQLEVMVRWWGPVFAATLTPETRETVQQLRKARNDWAHIDDSHPLDLDYARRIHALAEELLEEIESPLADELTRRTEDLQRDAIREDAREHGMSEGDVLIMQLTELQQQREALGEQLEEAQRIAHSATGRTRAVARQLAELQAQYAAVAGLRERYLELQSQLEEARRDGEREAADVSTVRTQLETATYAINQLQGESSRLHAELEATRLQIETLDPVETEIGKRWVMLVAALIMVLGVVILWLAQMAGQ
jgi:chromosome segregation ATPase